MAKLRFDNITMMGFNSFKLVPKKRTVNPNTVKKVTTRLIKGLCVKIDDEYKIQIDTKALKPDIIDKGHPDILVLDFTEESYNLRGVVSVFSRERDDKGNYVRYIRNVSQCKFFPGNKEKLVPFCNNWICSGYIVRKDSKLMFDFNECIAPKGYDTFIPDEDD